MKRNVITATDSIAIQWNKLQEVSAKCVGAIPCVVQDIKTREVLMLAYVNQETLAATRKTGLAVFWSTSRNCLWVKGKESGNLLCVLEIRINCEQNSLLFLVRPAKDSACHTKNKKGEYRRSCFYRWVEDDSLIFIDNEKKEKKS